MLLARRGPRSVRRAFTACRRFVPAGARFVPAQRIRPCQCPIRHFGRLAASGFGSVHRLYEVKDEIRSSSLGNVERSCATKPFLLDRPPPSGAPPSDFSWPYPVLCLGRGSVLLLRPPQPHGLGIYPPRQSKTASSLMFGLREILPQTSTRCL